MFLHRPIPRRQSSWSVSLLPLALYGLLLKSPSPVEGQSQAESLCTIEPRPVFLGLLEDNADFGWDISLSQDGTIAAFGAFGFDTNEDGGFVQVFRFENNVWTQLGSTIFGFNSSMTNSNALSDDGSILAVGGWNSRSVRVFRFVIDEWEPLGNNLMHPRGDFIGLDIAMSGDGTIVAASTPVAFYANIDEVLVFERVEGKWSQKGRTLQGQGEEYFFGESISLSQDGSRLAVGSPQDFAETSAGFVRVFDFIDNDWVQIGQTLEGTNVGDEFGKDVSLSSDGQTLAVGAPYADANSTELGTVHVYRFGSDGQWFEPDSMLIGKSEDNYFGGSVALSGDASILVVGGFVFLKADSSEWIEVGDETSYISLFYFEQISRDGSTLMAYAAVFDFSCTPGTTPDTASTSPILSPPQTTAAPLLLPTSAPIEAPEKTPIADSVPPDDDPAESSPTRVPRPNPTAGTMVQETFSDISLSFNGVRKLSGPESESFELLTIEWYESFFVEGSGREFPLNMQTTIEVTGQNVYLSEDESSLVNAIMYNQTIAYTAESNNTDPKRLIALPFKDFNANTEYGEILKSELDAFQDLQSPLPTPQFDTKTDNDAENDSTVSGIGKTDPGDGVEGEENAIGVIIGASIGGAVVLAIAVLVGIRVKKRKDGQRPPSAAGVIVYDGQGEALAPRTVPAQAVALASDNPTTLQKDSSEVHTPSAGVLEPSQPQQEMDTLVTETMAVSTQSDGYGYIVQFKDQTRSAAPEMLAQRDP